jgi:hypothetical protein
VWRLDDHGKRTLLRLVAHGAVFGMLCVLDAPRPVEVSSEKGQLELLEPIW